MKKLLLALALLCLPSAALAQCNGVFAAHTVCGNSSASPNIPGQIPQSAVTGIPGGTNGQIEYNNAGAFGGFTMSGDCTTNTSTGVITCTKSGGVTNRIRLTAPTTFFVSTAGTDVAGCGLASGASACSTRNYLTNTILASTYDLGGQQVTINIAAGTYVDGLVVSGKLTGQSGSIIYTGDCTAGHTSDVLIQPVTPQNSYASINGADIIVQCQKIDHTPIMALYTGADMFVASQGGILRMGNGALFGVRADITYGCNVNSWNIFSGSFYNGLYFNNDFNIDTALCTVTTTTTTTNGNNSLTNVANTTGLHAFMGIAGVGLPLDAYVGDTGVHFTASGSGTNLTVSNVVGSIATTKMIDGFGVPVGTFIVSQTSGPAGGAGVYVTNQATTVNGPVNQLPVTNTGIVTYSCLRTSPCQSSASASGVTIVFAGGGQVFMDLGGGFAIANTNGDPSYSIIVTVANYSFYTAGFFFINDLSTAVMNGLTFVNPGLSHGECSSVVSNSVLTVAVGSFYVPCRALTPDATYTTTLTAGSSTFTVASATGIRTGNAVTDIATPTCTSTAGTATLSCSSGTGIVNGMKAQGAGLLTGGNVVSGGGTTSPVMGGCGAGPRCVNGTPVYLSEASPVTIYFTNGKMDGSCVVQSISGTTVTLKDGSCVTGSGAVTLWFAGQVIRGGQYE